MEKNRKQREEQTEGGQGDRRKVGVDLKYPYLNVRLFKDPREHFKHHKLKKCIM